MCCDLVLGGEGAAVTWFLGGGRCCDLVPGGGGGLPIGVAHLPPPPPELK